MKGFWIGVLVVLISACSGKQENNKSLTHAEEVKLEQYRVAGQQLYVQHCSNCHQTDGKGLAKLYPPVDKSDYVDENFYQVICLMRHGMRGEVVVNGTVYNQPMPGIPQLTKLELAEIATYIYNSWGREEGIVTVHDTEKALQKCEEN